jgi:hypothetical protein
MKNGKLSVSLFPDSGHHFYFIPLGVGQGQGTPAEERFSLEQSLPKLGTLTALTALCRSESDWMPAMGPEKKEIVWLRARFGTKRETYPPNQQLEVFGLWCAIETNTGTRRDGYTYDVWPAHNDPGWVEWKQHPDESSPYFSTDPSEIDFKNAYVLNLDEAFDLSSKVGGSIGPCILEINWQIDEAEPVPVSLIVDFGNTRTIVVGLERAERIANSSLREIVRPVFFQRGHDEAAANVQPFSIHDLIPNSWIILREPTFANEQFVPDKFVWADYVTEKLKPGFFTRRRPEQNQERLVKIINRVPYMFIELSPVVFGPEATDLLANSDVTGGHLSFLSSPKRYSWDDDPVGEGGLSVWYMLPRTGQGRTSVLAGEMFRFLPRSAEMRRALVDEDDKGSPTEWEDESLKPTATPSPANFGRGDALIWTALAIIERSGKQIQSEAWRSKSPVRRFLDNVVVTFPPGWTNGEVLAYWRAWYLAKEIYNWSRGSHSVTITLDMRLDEAVASQLAIVYSEIRRVENRVDDWIQIYGLARDTLACVRVLTIDIGGGTTDSAVVEYANNSPGRSGVHLISEVLFSDSTTNAGDKLVKELIEAVFLPTLGERFRSDPERKQSFERFFSTSVGMRGAEDRLRRMVITRSVFVPMIYQWLDDISHNRNGKPTSGVKWDPIECGASLAQVEKLNAMFQEAGLDSLLQLGLPFDVDYERIKQVIRSWCAPLARLHAKYVATFDCDLVIVTGKPSELPMVQTLFQETLPLHSKRILFARDYDAGEWFPGAFGGKIPDAKMVTVIGAALFTAIKRNLIPDWTIDQKVGRQARNYWGVLSKMGAPFDAHAIFLTPDEDEIEVALSTNCYIARARFPENDPEPVYVLRWRNHSLAASNGSRDVTVQIRRVLTDREGKPLRNEKLELIDVSGTDTNNEAIEPDDLELHLCSLAFDEVHWLDQGKFVVQWD